MERDQGKGLMGKLRQISLSTWIVVFAAVLLEGIAVFQYSYSRRALKNQLEKIGRVALSSRTRSINNILDKAELTMKEHLWDIRSNLENPDSMFSVTGRLVGANPDVVGGCIAFVPGYYPSKGRLFETYATMEGDSVTVEQIASEDHDYTLNQAFSKAASDGVPFWSNPYRWEGEDSVAVLTTYSYPLRDSQGKVVAVCGLDVNISALSGILNQNLLYPSSFMVLLTDSGTLVEGADGGPSRKQLMEVLVPVINDSTSIKEIGRVSKVAIAEFTDPGNGRKAYVNFKSLGRDPGWTIAQITYKRDVFARMRKMMVLFLLLMAAGLAALYLILDRFVKKEKDLREAGIEKERIGSELRIAKNIQDELLPKTFPPFPDRKDVDVFGSLTPAKEVGGDLFDFFIRDGKLFFCIGDVSGKGVPSAIVMAVAQALFRMVSSAEDNPGKIVEAINKEICRNNDANMFITMFMGVLDLRSGTLSYCNAGHDRPFITGHGVEDLPVKTNLPIGVFDDTVFETQEKALQSGSTLFLYTDGLSEARNPRREQFTRQRLAETLESLASQPGITPQALVQGIGDKASHFMNQAPQADDLTMLAVKYSQKEEGGAVSLGEITLQNELAQIRRLNEFVKSVSAKLDADKKTTYDLRLSLEEIVVNVMNYAYPDGETGDIGIEALMDDGSVLFTVSDSGIAFDPTETSRADTSLSAEERPIGGLGILLARELMDSIGYERRDGKNFLTLKKKILQS